MCGRPLVIKMLNMKVEWLSWLHIRARTDADGAAMVLAAFFLLFVTSKSGTKYWD